LSNRFLDINWRFFNSSIWTGYVLSQSIITILASLFGGIVGGLTGLFSGIALIIPYIYTHGLSLIGIIDIISAGLYGFFIGIILGSKKIRLKFGYNAKYYYFFIILSMEFVFSLTFFLFNTVRLDLFNSGRLEIISPNAVIIGLISTFIIRLLKK